MHPHIRGTGAGDDPTHGQYRRAMMRAIDDLVKDRFMLCEDADDRLAAKGNSTPQSTVPHCLGNVPKK
jgi:hypothetical protein